MPDFSVSTAFNSVDRVSKAFKRMGISSDKFRNKATKNFKKASFAAAGFGNITKGILGAQAIGQGFNLLKRGVVGVTEEFISFDDSVTAASAKFKGLDLTTKAGQATLVKLKNTAREVGAETIFSATEAAQGLDFLAMAGFTADQSMASLFGVTSLATVGQVDLARATDIASDSLGAFGLMTKDANQLQANFTRLNDVMAKTMTSTNTNMEDMFEAIKKGAPQFTTSGQSLETFNTLLGIMANSGVKGSEAGTGLRNVMLRLAKPTGEAAKVLETLKVKTRDSKDNFLDIVDILGSFEKGLKGMGTAQRSANLATVFGNRAVTGVNILLQAGTKEIRKFRSELLASAGASDVMANVIGQSLGNRLKALKSALIEVGFKFFDAFEKKGRAGLNKLIESVRNFDPTPIIDFAKAFLKFSIGLFRVIQRIGPSILVLVGGLVAYKLAIGGIIALQAILHFAKFVKVLFLMARAKGVATAATWLFNVALTANPIGIVIAAVAGLIAIIVLLAKNWDIVVNALKSVWFWMKKIFASSLTGQLFAFIGKLTGITGGDNKVEIDKKVSLQREAPNSSEASARQQIDFQGKLDIAGAPKGSNFSSETQGADPIIAELLGQNP